MNGKDMGLRLRGFLEWALCAVSIAATLIIMAGCGARHGAHYGEPFSTERMATISELLERPESFQRQSVRVKGRITRQCPASGCWFFLEDTDKNSIKVELGDTLPKLPKKSGYQADVEGELIKHGDQPLFIGTRVTFLQEGV